MTDTSAFYDFPKSRVLWRSTRCQGNQLAVLLLAVTAAWLFRDHISGNRVFIGNSDRLNSMLNVVQHQIDSLHAGRFDAWDEQMFGGFNTFGLPYIFPQPLLFVEALAPNSWLIYVAGLVAWLLLTMAGWSAFACLKSITKHTWISFVGASLYQLSALTTLKVSQNESSFAVLIVIPLMLLLLRSVKPGREVKIFALMSGLLGLMFTCMFLQKAAYATMLGGSYALFRSVRLRDWRPVVLFGMASMAAGLVALPRIVTVGEEMRHLQRQVPGVPIGQFDEVRRFQGMSRLEVFRIFDDGFCAQVSPNGTREYLNLTEGMLLFTSGFTCFVLIFGGISMLLRFGLRSLFKDDQGFFACCVLFGLSVVTLKPVQYLMFELFLRMDFTHARVIIVSLFPLCALTAIVLKNFLELIGEGRASRTILPALVTAALLLLAIRSSHKVWKFPEDLNLPQTFGIVSLGRSAVLLLLSLGLFRWLDTRGPAIRSVGWKVLLALAWLVPMGCLLLLQAADREEWLRLIPDKSMCLRVKVLGQVEWIMLFTGLLVFLINYCGTNGQVGLFLVQTLCCLLVLDAIKRADHRMNGRDNLGEPVAFAEGNSLLAARGQFARPSPQARLALENRLEVQEFRSVLFVDEKRFPVFCASHISEFWGLRLLDGYSSGVPRYLHDLPWPKGVISLRAMQFSTKVQEENAWELLALCNVKYAVVVDQPLYRNQVVEGNSSREARPDDMEFVLNPIKPVPRHFFAARVKSVQNGGDAIEEILTVKDICTEIARCSFVEGSRGDAEYDAGGVLEVSYLGDEVLARFERSQYPRFLVLNELYHPRWRAYHARTELPVHRTNGFMRGVEIPPGADSVTLRFEPFVKTTAAAGIALGGVFVFVAGCLFLRWMGRRVLADRSTMLFPTA